MHKAAKEERERIINLLRSVKCDKKPTLPTYGQKATDNCLYPHEGDCWPMWTYDVEEIIELIEGNSNA